MPIKRSKSLIPLSHDHHQGLVVVRNIRNGLKRKVNPGRIAAYVRDFWDGDLRRHFEEEETLIFSLLPESDEGVQHALREHRQLREQIEQMQEGTESGLFVAFADLLDKHIRFEERTLFPHIEQTLSMADIVSVGKALQHDSIAPPICWGDAFWKD
jgi:hemerythrin-like domain-containing protein